MELRGKSKGSSREVQGNLRQVFQKKSKKTTKKQIEKSEPKGQNETESITEYSDKNFLISDWGPVSSAHAGGGIIFNEGNSLSPVTGLSAFTIKAGYRIAGWFVPGIRATLFNDNVNGERAMIPLWLRIF